MPEPHVHVFEGKYLKRIFQVQDKYSGTTGDKAFLCRMCKCGKLEVYDYGPTKVLAKR